MATRATPIYTIVLRNGNIVQFESNNVEIKATVDDLGLERVTIKASAKNNGLSLLYSRSSQIDAIVRDTSASALESDEENDE